MKAWGRNTALIFGWAAVVSMGVPALAQTAAPRPDAPLILHVPPPPGAAQSPPTVHRDLHVITDTREYCNSLHDRVDGMARTSKTPGEAIDLVREGQRLCETGKTRSGILHLRRAFILMRQPAGER